jgi:hypothetical protein
MAIAAPPRIVDKAKLAPVHVKDVDLAGISTGI